MFSGKGVIQDTTYLMNHMSSDTWTKIIGLKIPNESLIFCLQEVWIASEQSNEI